jgi:hypothetical protein
MSNTTFRTTVAEIIAELSQLPADQVLAIPVRWTLETVNDIYADQLIAPLTNDQWAEVAENYIENALPKFFWEDAELAMSEALEPYIKEDED